MGRGFLLLFGFWTVVFGFGSLVFLAGLVGNGTVHSKVILLEYGSGRTSWHGARLRMVWVYPCRAGRTLGV